MGTTLRPDELPTGLVTFLFTDIEGSTRLAHTLGDGYRRVLHEHRRLMRRIFTRYTGTELLTEGDSFFVAFSEAETALHAAVEVQLALKQHAWPTDPDWSGPARPKVRIGLHTAVAEPDEQGYATSAVHRAARVCAAAHGDQILCTQSTLDSTVSLPEKTTLIDLGLFTLRGFDDVNRLHQLTADGLPRSFPPPPIQPRHHNIPADADDFIGRGAELAQLARLVEGHRLTSVTALPQTGKTRLVRELGRRLIPSFHDGAWYATLDGGHDPGQGVVAAMGLRGDPFRSPLDTAIEALRHKSALLVFDGTLPWHAQHITRLLGECPQVSVLSASSRPLGLTGEVKWALPTMHVTEAAAVLRRQATAAAGGVDPGDCTELTTFIDGFPPAVTILAPAISLYGPSRLMARLRADPLAILDARGELSRILDTACEELSSRATHLLRAMSALPAPAGVDEAERLCGGSAEALEALIELVDASLVDVTRTRDGALYRLPAPVRWYADAQRRAVGQAAPILPLKPTRVPLPRLSWIGTVSA
ncbi:adenylate/guanylate cyclase domain-containing protein [Stackebrandtia nassauensis]|uniref:Putative adenylate/guanylate cyclase n=1 Tax=Stackebrandtia nassauensis (strain DSM 44728 / CIP 108903 / NRRL B-16338 / NBRC 102104 / LLR-40K-21) TaxID=446470 RepID=D3Q2U5_STANL|nr:adenylate/guanylate cyclase domain-containing protein [Stackebrandtia nassauensis]ADD45846.1 putative adenylate/guanylate cyclase [Stackebrandtia nassauensis DSM 44728]